MTRKAKLALFAGGAVLLGGVACAGDESLPVRKSGHWRITTIAASIGTSTIEACIGPADSIAAPADGRRCEPPSVTRADDQVIVNVVCDTKLGQERTSTLYTGDFTTWYRGIMKMTFDPPGNGPGSMGVTLDAKYVGPECPAAGPK